jgi:hypothetical protein
MTDDRESIPGSSYTGGSAGEDESRIDGSGNSESGDATGTPSVPDETEEPDETIPDPDRG